MSVDNNTFRSYLQAKIDLLQTLNQEPAQVAAYKELLELLDSGRFAWGGSERE